MWLLSLAISIFLITFWAITGWRAMRALETIAETLKSKTTPLPAPAASASSSKSTESEPSEPESVVAKSSDSESGDSERWECPDCGKSNPGRRETCCKCGYPD